MKKIVVRNDRRSVGRRPIIGGLFIVVAVTLLAVSCSDVQRNPGRVYMPDMAYSRAYETYATTDSIRAELLKKGIHFSNIPVAGTIKRGELLPFGLQKDAAGDSANYVASRQIKNPLTSMDTVEAERLYLVNCAICHGPKLDGNGPLYKGGDGPFPAAPANFISGKPEYLSMPEGQMFYSATYGKNKMGSYASQINTEQRWMVVAYIKSKQAAATAKPAAAAAPAAGTPASGGGSDSTTKK